jgi:hypothetical protein
VFGFFEMATEHTMNTGSPSEESQWENVISRAIEQSMENFLKESTKNVLSGAVSNAIRELTGTAVGALAGGVLSVLLKCVLTQHPSLLIKINKLVYEPFQTGMRIAEESMRLPCRSEQEVVFREDMLKLSLHKLNEAQTLLYEPDYVDERFAISVIRTLCAAQIRGGGSLAEMWAGEVLTLVEHRLSNAKKLFGKAHSEAIIARWREQHWLHMVHRPRRLNTKLPANRRRFVHVPKSRS